MKIKKIIIGIGLALITGLICSCGGEKKPVDESKTTPKVVSLKAYDYNQRELHFEEYGVVDSSKFYYLEMKFDKNMDTTGNWGYASWYENEERNFTSLYATFWKDSKTLAFYFDLNYERTERIAILLNSSGWSLADQNMYYIRDNYGNPMDEYFIHFIATPPAQGTYPKVISVTGYDKSGSPAYYPSSDGKIYDIDPKNISYIDIQFNKPMNSNIPGYMYYNKLDPNVYRKWINPTTLRMTPDVFFYGKDYMMQFNTFFDADANLSEAWFSDTKGVYADNLVIAFSTIQSPEGHKKEYVIDLNAALEEDFMLVELTKNQYAKNYQTGFSIAGLLDNETLLPGDKVTLKYKIRSDYDLPEIYVNLVDISQIANYWNVLCDETINVPFMNEEVKASTEENPVYYENEITFLVTKEMTTSCTIQLTTEDLSHKDPYQFFVSKN